MFSKIEKIIRDRYQGDLIALHEPIIGDIEKKYVNKCLDSTFVSSIGAYVGEFEDRIAKFTGSQYAIATTNGTSALSIALLLSGVERDTEVITQNLTFVATANAILHIGAKPIFIDSSSDNLGLCPDILAEFLKSSVVIKDDGKPYNKETGARISALVPMHVFGHTVKMDKLLEVCEKFKIPVVEDAAEALGSYDKSGKHLGTLAPIGVLSFNGNKVITTGGGGMILCQEESVAKLAKHMTTTAKKPHQFEFFHDQVGYNYRLPNINAALGCAQMDRIESFLINKQETSEYYHKAFSEIGITTIKAPEGSKSNYWLNSILFEQKDELLKHLNDSKILARPIWNLMSDLPFLKDYQIIDRGYAAKYREQIVSIPSGAIV